MHKRPHSRSAFGVIELSSRHPAVRRLKRQYPTQLHGNKPWAANYLLLDYLLAYPPAKGSRILEVGSGWGLAGIGCARHFDASVVATDADAAVFPFLQLHAEHNGVAVRTQQRRIQDLGSTQLAGFDWLIAADICFWDTLADPVFELVARACEAGVGKIVIADPQRPPFLEMAERCVDVFHAELEPRCVSTPRRVRGAVLVIENR